MNNQFIARALVGVILSGLLVLSFAWLRIQETSEFADQNLRLFFAAIDDVETMRNVCCVPCQDLALRYPALMTRYGYNAERPGEHEQ